MSLYLKYRLLRLLSKFSACPNSAHFRSLHLGNHGHAALTGPLYIRLCVESSSPCVFLSGRSFFSSEAAAMAIPATEGSSQAMEETPSGDAAGFHEAHEIERERLARAEADLLLEHAVKTPVLEMHSTAPKEECLANKTVDLMRNLGATMMRKLIEEQRESLSELQAQLQDQKAMLNSILENISLLKSQLETKVELVVSAVNPLSKPNVDTGANALSDSRERKNEKGPDAVNALCVKNTEKGGTHVPSEKNSENGAKLAKTEVEVETGKFQHPPWPEWAMFLDHLKSFAYIVEEKQRDVAGAGEIFNNTALLKRTLVKFAQAHETVFKRLSQKDLHTLAQYEFPSNDERTAAAKKRVQIYLQKEESNVSSSKSAEATQAKLTDVMRLIYRAVSSASSLDALSSELKSALVHLLQDLISLSSIKHDNATSRLDATPIRAKQGNGNASKLVEMEVIKNDQGSGQKIQVVKVEGAKALGNIELDMEAVAPIAEWKCPRCSFMNLPQKSICVQCDLSQLASISCTPDPESVTTTKTAEVGSPFINEYSEPQKFRSLKERVDERRARLARESLQKEAASLQPPLTQEPGLKNYTKCSIGLDDSKDGCDSARNFQAFDAIIESEDSDDCVASTAQRDTASRASLSTLVRKCAKSFSSRKGGGQKGMPRWDESERRDERTVRGGKHREEDLDSKSRRASKRGEDEDGGGDGREDEDQLEDEADNEDEFEDEDGGGGGGRDYGGRGGSGYRGRVYGGGGHSGRRYGGDCGERGFRGDSYSKRGSDMGNTDFKGDFYSNRSSDRSWRGSKPYGGDSFSQARRKEEGLRPGRDDGRGTGGRGRPRY